MTFDGNPATVGNGVMVALEARDAEQVQRLHAIALANGGTCEGHLLVQVAFTVTTTADDDDAVPGDGVCATSAGACSSLL